MGDLSENFSSWEFACKGKGCCGGSSPVAPRLIEALEKLRLRLGEPIAINSGFRCLTHNRRIGSKDTSEHPKATAGDIKTRKHTPAEVAEVADTIPEFSNGGIGIYKDFTHLDVRTGDPARWMGHQHTFGMIGGRKSGRE